MNDPNRTGPYQPATADHAADDQPQAIGRYRVVRVLGDLWVYRGWLATGVASR
jgi:hypothetical protein